MDASPLAVVAPLLEARKNLPGGLLPLLHDIQDALGYVPPAAVPLIATALNLSRAEVHGVVSYYHHFRQVPAGRHVLRICRAEACQAVGADGLIAQAQAALGCGWHATTADGAVTLEPVFCLGQCAVGPNLLVDEDELHARVTPAAFDRLLEGLREPS
ncbi:MAG: formate dehydrogenase subunit gamma [Rhodocyclales bacterium]|nr:formate dehydrogenase subunit gamma [Rhodocyclales bacterium]